MELPKLKKNLSIQETSFVELYLFKCGNIVPLYDIKSIYGLNQIIGYAKFTARKYGEVLYRGECNQIIIFVKKNKDGTDSNDNPDGFRSQKEVRCALR